MKSYLHPLFPDDISDEAASVLCEFVQALALACDSRYFNQLRRYHSKQQNLFDPDHPWRTHPQER